MPIINILTFSLKDKGEKDRASIVDIVKAIIAGTRGLVNGATKKPTFKRLPLKIRSFGISQM
jgi:hypothetical protein